MHHPSSPHPDICIAGAGIIGLSLALELHHRGHRVTVFDQGAPLAEASAAAAGMLAAQDPDNPPQLLPLADLSLSLYPNFLDRLYNLSHIRVPFQTHTTLQALPRHHPHLAQRTHPRRPLSSPPYTHPHRPPLHPPRRAQPRPSPTRRRTPRIHPCHHHRPPPPQTTILSTRSINNSVEIITTRRPPSIRHTSSTALERGPPPPRLFPHLQVVPRKGQMLSSPFLPPCRFTSSSAHPTSI